MKENSIAKILDLLPVRKQLFESEDEYTANIKDSRIPNSIINIDIIEKTSLLSSANKREREKKKFFEGNFNLD